MLEQFKIQVEALLIEQKISPDCHLVENFFLKEAGIEMPETALHSHYRFSIDNENKSVFFYPPKLNVSELSQLLKLAGVSEASYFPGTPITINPSVLMQFITTFEEKFQQIVRETPERLMPYIIESIPKFEGLAKERILKSLKPCFTTLDSKKLTKEEDDLFFLLGALENAISKLDRDDKYYKYIAKISDKLVQFHQEYTQSQASHATLLSNLTELLKQIALFREHNLSESILGAKECYNTLQKILSPHKVHPATCDIFEHTLLKLAGISALPSRCAFAPSRIKTHVLIILQDIALEEAEQFRAYFEANGDKTAKVSLGSKYSFENSLGWNTVSSDHYDFFNDFGSCVHEQGAILEAMPAKVIKAPDVYCIQVDGKVMHESIMPLFEEAISRLTKSSLDNDKATLENYCAKSKSYLNEQNVTDTLEEATNPSDIHPATFFAPPQAVKKSSQATSAEPTKTS